MCVRDPAPPSVQGVDGVGTVGKRAKDRNGSKVTELHVNSSNHQHLTHIVMILKRCGRSGAPSDENIVLLVVQVDVNILSASIFCIQTPFAVQASCSMQCLTGVPRPLG